MWLYTIIIYPLQLVIEFSFRLFLDVFKNTGITVIGVSLAVSLLCLPLYAVAEKWQETERNTQKKLKEGIQRIKDVFKGDEQYMILSTFYKQNHYHPLMALRSSFGLMIQIPFFIAAYSFLSKMSALQGARFLFIRNMGQPDALFSIGNFPINILPIAMTLINCAAGAIYTKGFPIKEKIQIYGMALIFLVLLYDSPSGLVLYWTLNNVFSLVKNIFYKFKNPLKAFYLCCALAIAFMDFYVIFLHHGSVQRRLLMAACMTALLLIPLLIKFGSWLLDNVFNIFLDNQKACISFFILSSISIWLLAGLVIPTLLISSSVTEFADIDNVASPIYFIKLTALQSFGFCVFWPLCIYFLFNKRVKASFTILSIASLLIGIGNTFLFSSSYGTLTRMITFSDGLPRAPVLSAVNLLFAIFVFLLLIFIFKVKSSFKILNPILVILPVSLTVVSLSMSAKITKDYNEHAEYVKPLENPVTEIKPVLHLSKTGKNVFLFMLDRAESAFVDSIFDEFPEFKEIYSGFTFYPNTIAFGGHTLLGAPPLFGGYEYTPNEMIKRSNEKLVDKNNQALMLLPRIFTEQADFSATVTDASWANYSWIPDMSIFKDCKNTTAMLLERNYTSLWIKENPDKIKANLVSSAIKRNLLFFSLFKTIPAVFRDALYDEGNWWSSDTNSGDLQEFLDYYSVLDFLPRLTDFSAQGNTFFSIVNDTTHSGQELQPPLYEPAVKITEHGKGKLSKISSYSGNAAAFRLLSKWIEYLKENDVYDNSRIIIVSDHGIGYGDAERLTFTEPFYDSFNRDHLHPVLFFKDFGAEGAVKKDNTFMTTADVPSLLTKDIITEAKNPFTGKILSDEIKHTEGAIVSSDDSWSPGQHGKYVFKISDDKWYTVKENIFDIKNWQKGR